MLVFTTRPDIEDARDQLESSWDSAAPALDTRFQVLAMVNNSVAETPGPVGEISNEVSDMLEEWLEARADGSRDDAIRLANELEGVGRRLVLAVKASPRLSADPNVTGPIDAYAGSPQPGELAAFADAARAYAKERKGALNGLVSDMFGYDEVPTIAVPTSA